MPSLLLTLLLSAAAAPDAGLNASPPPDRFPSPLALPPPLPAGPSGLRAALAPDAGGNPTVTKPAPRRVLVELQTPATDLAPLIAAQLKATGAEQIPEPKVRAAVRGLARGQAGGREAETLRRRGLDAEQNLDLDAALDALAQAEHLLEQAGAAAEDPESLAQVRLELAQCLDEKGDRAGAESKLRRWAELGPSALDPKSYPPAFVSLSQQAQAETPLLALPLPVAAVWRSALVDEVLVLSPAGPADGPAAVLIHYATGKSQPDHLIAVPRTATAPDQRAAAEQAIREALGGSRAANTAVPAAGPTGRAVTAPGDELKYPLTLMAGFAFPQSDAYSHYGVSTLGIGFAIGGRMVLSLGEVGVRLDILGATFAIAQFTPTVRWTWHKGRIIFNVEPGVFLQVRTGCTQPPCPNGTPSDVLFGAEAGTGIGYQLSESFSIEEQFKLGVIAAGNYDLNLPFGFQSRLAYAF